MQHLVILLVAGRGQQDFGATLRVSCYSVGASALGAWVPLAGLFIFPYGFYVYMVSLKRVHRISNGRALAAVLIFTALSLALWAVVTSPAKKPCKPPTWAPGSRQIRRSPRRSPSLTTYRRQRHRGTCRPESFWRGGAYGRQRGPGGGKRAQVKGLRYVRPGIRRPLHGGDRPHRRPRRISQWNPGHSGGLERQRGRDKQQEFRKRHQERRRHPVLHGLRRVYFTIQLLRVSDKATILLPELLDGRRLVLSVVCWSGKTEIEYGRKS